MYTIWGRPNCVWCERAKELLKNNNEPFEYIELHSGNLAGFKAVTGNAKTVPQIFFNGERIGGYEALVEFYTNIMTAETNLA